MYTYIHTYIHTYRPVARGGSGGSYDPPPQLPIPNILFHPLAILFHPLAILFHLSAILFHPLAILFHPWNMWMTSHGQCPRGGGACECPRVGAFFKLMTSRGQCPRGGGAPGVPPIQVQTPPTWLAGYGPVHTYMYIHTAPSGSMLVSATVHATRCMLPSATRAGACNKSGRFSISLLAERGLGESISCSVLIP